MTSSFTDEEARLLSSPCVKEEIIHDEDVLLFTPAEMEEFSNDSTNFQMVHELVNSESASSNAAPYNIQKFNDAHDSSMLFTKYPIDLSQMCKFESTKIDHTSHYVKYKLQDGKHSKVWECGICAKEFGHQYTLMRHLPTHTDERKFSCNSCGKAFRQMSTLSQHRAIHSDNRPYCCEICQKAFNRVSTLISHRKTHTGMKPHRCHLCNKAFHQKGNLRNHIFTHTNERPYKCDVCSKGFNQMSNLMCHKMKAHHRADKPKYSCHVCGKDFQKRIGLRNHEQYQHGVQNPDSAITTLTPTRIKYTNGVLVNPIDTAAMQLALSTNQTPFALLRPLNGIPVLVRVLGAGEKQMLVPATAEDLKKHGKITITSKIGTDSDENKENNGLDTFQEDGKSMVATTGMSQSGSTVQIKIPVVATVVQRCGEDGNMCMAVQSPGPNVEESSKETYVFTTPVDEITNFPQTFNQVNFNTFNDENQVGSSQFKFMDDCGNLVESGEDSKELATNIINYEQQNDNFATNLQLESNGINIHDNQGNNIGYMDQPPQIFESAFYKAPVYPIHHHHPTLIIPFTIQILEKPQVISLSDTENILDTSNVLYDDSNLITNYIS